MSSTTSETDSMATRDGEVSAGGAEQSVSRERDGAAPSASEQVFSSLFSPTWSLGLLLFACIFLPTVKNCNGNTVYVCSQLAEEGLSAPEIYGKFVIVWPFLLGLVICLGTLRMICSGAPVRARFLWWSFAVLIIANAGLLACGFGPDMLSGLSELVAGEEVAWDFDHLEGPLWIGTSLALLAALPVTRRYCRNWYDSAMWLQLCLVLTAAIFLSFVLPAIFLAEERLIGGKLAAACGVLLIITTIIQLLDGRRALTRLRGESRLRLSLKAMLILMQIGGMACVWISVVTFVNPSFGLPVFHEVESGPAEPPADVPAEVPAEE